MKEITVFIFLLFFCVPLWAQVDTVSTHQLNEVDVLAQSLNSQPSTLNQKDFVRLNITDINSALQRLPSITLKDYGGAGGMKTVSVRGLGAQHTGVSYDGIILSEIQGGQIDLSRYNMDDVESIALTVGGSTNIFKPARQLTTASLLEISTPEILKSQNPEILAQVRTGSFGYVNPYIRYSQSMSKKMTVGLTADYIHAENNYKFLLKNGSTSSWERRTNSRMNSFHGEARLNWQPTEKSLYALKIYYYDNDRQLPGIVRYYTDLNKENLHDKNFFAQFSSLFAFHSSLSLQCKAKFNWQMTDYQDRLYANSPTNSKYWQREYYATTSICWQPLNGLSFDYSIDFIHNNLNSTRETDSQPWRNSLLQSLAGKYENRWLTAVATLLRSDYYNGEKIERTRGLQDAHSFSPSFNLSFRPFESLTSHLSPLTLNLYYKETFRNPTFNELYYYHLGSQNLLPEKAKMLGLGANYSFKSKHGFLLSAKLDVYKNRVDNKISAVPYNIFVWRCVNVDRAEGWGVDMGISASQDFGRSYKIILSGNYSLQNMEDKTEGSRGYGNQLAYIPRNSYSVVGSFENPWVNMSMSEVFSGENWSNNEHYEDSWLRGYAVWGASLWREFKIKKSLIPHPSSLIMQVDLQNIFNHQYSIVKGYPMPGRSIMIKLKFKI